MIANMSFKHNIEQEIVNVLQTANEQNNTLSYMTAYQIFEELPDAVKNQLLAQYGNSGKNANSYGSSTYIANIAVKSNRIETAYLDCRNIQISINNSNIEPSGNTCGLFRLRQ